VVVTEPAYVKPKDIDTTSVPDIKDRPKRVQENVTSALNKAVREGKVHSMHRLPPESKQAYADSLFSNRDLNVDSWGMSGNQSKIDRDYRGFTTKMEPLAFLRLAKSRNTRLNREVANKDMQRNILDKYAKGIKVRVAPPILYLKDVDGKLVVKGHEGRHRSDAMLSLLGYDGYQIPVDIHINGRRAKDLDGSEWSKELIDESGKSTGLTLGELFNTKEIKK